MPEDIDLDILKLLRDCALDTERAAIDADIAAHREQRRAIMSGARVADIARGRVRETHGRPA